MRQDGGCEALPLVLLNPRAQLTLSLSTRVMRAVRTVEQSQPLNLPTLTPTLTPPPTPPLTRSLTLNPRRIRVPSIHAEFLQCTQYACSVNPCRNHPQKGNCEGLAECLPTYSVIAIATYN